MKIGKRLSGLREERQLGQKELAAVLGVLPKTVSDYENDTVRPSLDVFIKLAHYYDVSLDYLTGLSDKQTPLENKCIYVLPKGFPQSALTDLDRYVRFLVFEHEID